MNEICPVCNGLYDTLRYCYRCQQPLVQLGRIEDYKGPYSPYIDMDLFQDNRDTFTTGDNCCTHLYKCPSCATIYHGSSLL